VPLFALTVFASAFLLFQVQPLISRLILPWFGGSPAVWTAAMLFFQTALFGGYLYAHLTTTRLSATAQCAVHLGLLAAATAAALATGTVPPGWLRPEGSAAGSPVLRIFLLLGITVGLPYFALSATGPLLQRWFTRVVPGRSPYRLFALSNVGSLLALLTYPLFVEPAWGGRTQAACWTAGFAAFAACCGLCVGQVRRAAPGHEPTVAATAGTRRGDRLLAAAWVGLPALGSVLFLAVTNEVCQNVATVPLLWIVPLSLYLLSFIVAFDHPRWYPRRLAAAAAVVLVAVMAGYDRLADRTGLAVFDHWWMESAVMFAGLAVLLLVCHGELARLKPDGTRLTAYYLSMSAGGAVGGLLVNLVAPRVFTTFREFPLALAAAAAVAAAVLAAGGVAAPPGRLLRWSGVTLGLAAIGGTWHWRLAAAPPRPDRRVAHESRTFYGTLAVQERDIGAPDASFAFFSGHIQHGRQFSAAERRREPLTYYGAGSGVEAAVRHVQRQSDACHVGVVGLGVGTLATYARPGDRYRFYELNPGVIDVARNAAWFHYLADCRGTVDVVVGDARLELERELAGGAGHGFDLLVLDAFSGDAIPAHLLTTEAFAVYDRHLRPGGVLAVHVTNTYLDIQPVVRRLAEEHGFLHRRIYRAEDAERLLYRNDWMLLSRDPEAVIPAADDVEVLPDRYRQPRAVPLWTDDYGSLLPLLL